jgi:hypothetical protein
MGSHMLLFRGFDVAVDFPFGDWVRYRSHSRRFLLEEVLKRYWT